jgi:hypothetical protein
MPSPDRRDVSKELWQIATTLTPEAQDAATRKAREQGYDTDRGHISLEETLINLSDARDIIVDAVEKKKVNLLPLKLQFSLLSQLNEAGDQLTNISNGKDSIQALEGAVEELTASMWSFRLHNLSGQVLGYETKMNQLKVQETTIRQAANAAQDIGGVRRQLDDAVAQVSSIVEATTRDQQKTGEALEATKLLLKEVTESREKAAAASAQVQQNEQTTTQQLSSITQIAANVQTAEMSVKEHTADIELKRTELNELVSQVATLVDSTESTTNSQIESFKSEYAKLETNTTVSLDSLITRTREQTEKLSTSVSEALTEAKSGIESSGADLDSRVTKFVDDSEVRLTDAESTHKSKLEIALKESAANSTKAIATFKESALVKLSDIQTEHDVLTKVQTDRFSALVDNLEELEGRIRESIERATGYGLFHSFQTRQLAIAAEKTFWSRALFCAVFVSLLASVGFIISLHWVKTYNAAFYLKLSISIPLIYAIAFCNVQYSRERRLEEEYAFKSNISISLDPYQRLVRQLVDQEKPEEVAKYTAFVIESVNKVFTSPTTTIFDDKGTDVSGVQKLLKSLGDLIDPLVKALKK